MDLLRGSSSRRGGSILDPRRNSQSTPGSIVVTSAPPHPSQDQNQVFMQPGSAALHPSSGSEQFLHPNSFPGSQGGHPGSGPQEGFVIPNAPPPLHRTTSDHEINQMPDSNKGKANGTGWMLLLLLVICVVAVTIAFTIAMSNQSSGVSSHMIVLTGRRTRDWSTPNSYSMNSFDEDQHTRLYICMKAADITVPGDPEIKALGEFRAAVKNHHDCALESDRGWPRDYGFLRCIQTNFNANFHQSNVFLKCLDLSEGAMVESIQTPASTLFLGSYNFVTMLLASMGVITAFLIFTAGGYYTSSEFYVSHGHVSSKQFWSPLSMIPTLLALLWSLIMWVAAMIYAFPPNNMWSDAIDEASGSLPGTPWTGFICSGVSSGLVVYFLSCLGELYFDYADQRGDGGFKKFDGSVNRSQSNPSQTQSVIDQHSRSDPMSIVKSGDPTYNPESGQWQSTSHRNLDPPKVEVDKNGRPVIFASRFSNFTNRFGYSRLPAQLGVKYNSQLNYTGNDATKIAPSLNKTFALTWVFADGLLFVGMLNGQNSILNENVVAILYYIVLCRGFQLAASFFMDDVLFTDEYANLKDIFRKSPELHEVQIRKNQSNNNKAHAGIAVAFSHLASLWCMMIVQYHFFSANSLAASLDTAGVGNPTHLLQIFFLIFIIAMDAFKHIVALITIFNFLTQEHYLIIIEIIFSMDWIIRFVFITAAMFKVPHFLWEANQDLRSTILQAAI